MAYETLLYETDDRVATITLNRPERHNALSQKLCAELVEAVRRADEDAEVRVLVITGAGGKAFSAGYDIKESAEAPKRTLSEWRDRLNRDLRFTCSVWDCSKPVIAMIDGFCLAGALEFAQMCDLRIASEVSKFAVIETRFSNGIATYVMPWIIGARARRLIYTGDMIDAAEALRLGLVDLVYPKARLQQETTKLAKRMSRVALAALQWNKRALNNTLDTMGFRAALQYGVEACSLLDATHTPEYAHFDELRRTKGLAEALKWRDAQFAPFE
ncbi:MAG TPA: enoyl-CoA hydratase-related protein [Candidatus Bathyarchaeia archaeon]|nr:enoyl-CoA hydratase-related protein [Candidatus Bathyarchaeia archaeon]